MLPVYLLDTENIRDEWTDILYLAGPDDEIYLFYTDKSVAVHMSSLAALQESRARLEWVECHRVGANCANALDFQMVSQLGYLIRENISLGKKALYYLVTCDGGFDSVVQYWRKRNIFIQRLVTEAHPNQDVKHGPVLDLSAEAVNSAPLAVKPNFAMIRKYSDMFVPYLRDSEYWPYRHEIARVFYRLWLDRMPADKFALAFRNALASKYGSKNDIYKRLKPQIDMLRAGVAQQKPAEPVAPVTTAPVAASASQKPTTKPAVKSVDMKALSMILNRNEMQNLKAAIMARLPTDMKQYADKLLKMQALSIDPDLATWLINYLTMLRDDSQIVFGKCPDSVCRIDHSYFTKKIKADIMALMN